MPRCLECGSMFRAKGTGRPRLFCGDRCKERVRRRRERDREEVARQGVNYAPNQGRADRIAARAMEGPACRVCDSRPAEVGPPGAPILCAECSGA